MKFDIPKIVRELMLSEYAAEYGDRKICVWVNPPMRLLQEHDQILSDVLRAMKKGIAPDAAFDIKAIEQAAERLTVVFSELWSQGPEEMRWTEQEVVDLVAETKESEPQLWPWLREKTISMIRDYRYAVKKV